MRVFILEDDPNRVEWMERNMSGQLDITDQVKTGIEWLNTKEYDIIFLDHDLGGLAYTNSEEFNTGATIAKMIHKTINKGLTVIVHSLNPPGSKVMIDTMKDNNVKCFQLPFLSSDFIQAVKNLNNMEK